MLLPYQARGQFKPYGLPRINWNHPLAVGLVFYGFDLGDGTIIDLVSGKRGSNASSTPGQKRSSSKWGAANLYPDNSTTSGVNFTSSAIIKGLAAPFSIATGAVQTVNTSQFDTHIFGRLGTGTSSENWAFQAANGGTNGTSRFAWNDNAGFEITVDAGNYVNNAFTTWLAVFTSGGGVSTWNNGVAVASSGGTFKNQATSDNIAFGYNPANSGWSFTGLVFYGAVWNRDISAQALDLHNHPYGLLVWPRVDAATLFSLQSAGGAVSVSLTGVNATAAAGAPTVTGIGNVTLTGVNATAAAGTATISGKANFTLTGVSGTTAVNVPTITAAANITPTGVVGTTAVNIPTVTGLANVTLSGVTATGQAGTVTVTTGGAVNVNLTGVNATAAVGTLTVTGLANVTLTGIAATAQIGTLTTSAAANANVTGVAATSAVSTPTVTGLANVSLSGVLATVAAGNITVSVPTAVSVNIPGVSASASAGTVTTNLDAAVTFGGGISYSQREFDRIIRLDYEEWKRKHKKNKKLDKAVEEAIEVLEEVAVRGLLDDLAPAIELKETIEALPTEPKAIAAVIEDIREQTKILERMLDEDEDDIMLMIWALD